MKKILYFAASALMLISLSGCHKVTTEGMTGITYYPVITLEGNTKMVIEKGSTFKDPGYSATLNGKDVTSEVIVDSDVNTAQSGVYSISYTCFNEDGFSANSTRTVIVLDSKDKIEGFYLTDLSSNRNGVAYGKQFEVLMIGQGNGVYVLDDVLGGWYCQRAGYGTKYAMEAKIQINGDGTTSLISSHIPGWGDGLDSFEGTYDHATNSFTYKAVYANTLTFNVKLVKK